ncbi:MAG TPA: divalent-cation tolerance protein CutA [Verrucomicrobiae bacterium]|nr:divalent-cation tolerance protein CutA [Verrucomicrobiae bacterium]
MTKRDYCYLYLTCEDAAQASRIAKSLLGRRLVVCAKQVPVQAAYWWESKITHANEVLLVMESALDLFDRVEAAVAKLHSYDTFVLEAVPIAAVSTKAKAWMEENLDG